MSKITQYPKLCFEMAIRDVNSPQVPKVEDIKNSAEKAKLGKVVIIKDAAFSTSVHSNSDHLPSFCVEYELPQIICSSTVSVHR